MKKKKKTLPSLMVDRTLQTLFHDLGLRIREWQREERWMREGIGYV